MQFKFAWILTIFILSCCYFAHLNALDFTAVSSIVRPKTIKCYKCGSPTDDNCKNITNFLQDDEMIEECKPGAQGCVKQLVERSDGRLKATFRECYYGNINYFITNFYCEKIVRSPSYDKVKCYKCRSNLCNSSNRTHSTLSLWYTTVLLIVGTYILRK